MKKLVNGVLRDLTPEEVAEYNARQEAYESATQSRILSALAAHRYKVETGGITVNGLSVSTDDRSKLMLNGARNAAMVNEEFVTKWKTPQGFVTLNSAQIIALSDAVAAHVNACFLAEAQVTQNINLYATAEDAIEVFNEEMA